MRISLTARRHGVGFLAALVIATVVGGYSQLRAQTPFFPYHGKNFIHYDTFDWKIYQTEHYEIFYYPAIERHLERIAGYAESAYEKISADLTHELHFKIPLVLFKTHSEFEQQNIAPPEVSSEGVAAFAESERNRTSPDRYMIGAQLARYAELPGALPRDAVLGYLSDLPREDSRSTLLFLGAQYALAPRLLPHEHLLAVDGHFEPDAVLEHRLLFALGEIEVRDRRLSARRRP